MKTLRISSAQVKIQQVHAIFETRNRFLFSNLASLFSVMRYNSSIPFLAEILYAFNKRSLSKYKFGDISREQSKSHILHFDGFLLSQSYKVSVKKVQESYLS